MFSKMVQPSPKDRLTIVQIKSHPWYMGPVATSEEIISEFSRRHTRLQSIKAAKKNQGECGFWWHRRFIHPV